MKHRLLCLLGILSVALTPSQEGFAAATSGASSSDIEAKVKATGLPYETMDDGGFLVKVGPGEGLSQMVLVDGHTRTFANTEFMIMTALADTGDSRPVNEADMKKLLASFPPRLGHWVLSKPSSPGGGWGLGYTIQLPNSASVGEFEAAIRECYSVASERGNISMSDFDGNAVSSKEEMSAIRDSLNAVGVKLQPDNLPGLNDVVAKFTGPGGKSYAISVEQNTFKRNGQTFRMVGGALLNRTQPTEEQLERFLVLNGEYKLGGIVVICKEDKSGIFARVPVPANADGATLQAAMNACAAIVCEVDGMIPKKSESRPATPEEWMAALSTLPKPESSSTVSTGDISGILAKAEDQDGIVIGGLYLGMKIDDAKRMIAHLLGTGFNVSDWKCDASDSYGDYAIYFIGGISGAGMSDHTLSARVSKKDNRVKSFWFTAPVVKKLVGKKQPVSRERLGSLFFSKFDLDIEHTWDGLKMVTPDRECIEYHNSDSSISWEFELF